MINYTRLCATTPTGPPPHDGDNPTTGPRTRALPDPAKCCAVQWVVRDWLLLLISKQCYWDRAARLTRQSVHCLCQCSARVDAGLSSPAANANHSGRPLCHSYSSFHSHGLCVRSYNVSCLPGAPRSLLSTDSVRALINTAVCKPARQKGEMARR